MKRFSKVMVLLAALLLGCAFIGCSHSPEAGGISEADFNSDRITDEHSGLCRKYKNTSIDRKICFWSDGFFTLEEPAGHSFEEVTLEAGTWTGNTVTNGTVTVTITKSYNESSHQLVTLEDDAIRTETVTFSNGTTAVYNGVTYTH